MASVNAVAQILIPPPKYSIGQLIPGVATARKAKLSHMIVIEVGPDLEMSLDFPDAVRTLLSNCEDAYGFPPYAALAPFLYFWNGEDLRIMERDIIKEALASCPATLIRSQTRSWWERVPSLLGECATVKGATSAPEPALEARGAQAASMRPGAELSPAAALWEEDDLPEWL